MSANQLVENLQSLTFQSADSKQAADSINAQNLFTAVPNLVNKLKEIINKVSQDISAQGNGNLAGSLKESDQSLIYEAFKNFTRVHQELLNRITAKHGVMSMPALTAPITQVLRALEESVDALVFNIIDSIPHHDKECKSSKGSLDGAFGKAISTYDS
ncbi:hypothetical protein TruAng_004319 [Truncatella angustata]|nr:hypothetical protein TruAng_004319 [Truncatella angustata]